MPSGQHQYKGQPQQGSGNCGEEAKTKEVKKFVYSKLRNGSTPTLLIPKVQEKFGLGYDMARKIVYDCNAILKINTEELAKDAAHYVVNSLQKLIEESMESGDRKSAIAANTLLAKVTRLSDDRPQVTINNYGFDFDGGESDD